MCRELERTYFCETSAYGEPRHAHGAVWTEERCGVARAHGWDNCGHFRRPPLRDNRNHCKNTTCCMLFINNALVKWARAVKDAGFKSSKASKKYGRRAYDYAKRHEKSCGFRQDKFDELRSEAMETFKFTRKDLTSRYYGPYRW